MTRADDTRAASADDDRALADAIRAADIGAFETVLHAHGAALLAVARRLLRDEDEAREALQDAMMSAFKACRRFEGASRVYTWLHRIVVNSCLMRMRKRTRRAEVSIEPLMPSFTPDGHVDAVFADWSQAADALLEREEVCARVREAIDRLPETYRTALVMRDIEGMDIDEIAAALGISSNAVKIRVHRARHALRDALDPLFVGELLR